MSQGCTGTVPRRRSSQCFCLKYVAANIDEEGSFEASSDHEASEFSLQQRTDADEADLELIFWNPSNECRLLLTGNNLYPPLRSSPRPPRPLRWNRPTTRSWPRTPSTTNIPCSTTTSLLRRCTTRSR
uniref:(northern house mosquito) hypothetical protein n=1 Tax=Culex pipiens TaxID=7175 RepID=A0A8D8PFG6_CULPI